MHVLICVLGVFLVLGIGAWWIRRRLFKYSRLFYIRVLRIVLLLFVWINGLAFMGLLGLEILAKINTNIHDAFSQQIINANRQKFLSLNQNQISHRLDQGLPAVAKLSQQQKTSAHDVKNVLELISGAKGDIYVGKVKITAMPRSFCSPLTKKICLSHTYEHENVLSLLAHEMGHLADRRFHDYMLIELLYYIMMNHQELIIVEIRADHSVFVVAKAIQTKCNYQPALLYSPFGRSTSLIKDVLDKRINFELPKKPEKKPVCQQTQSKTSSNKVPTVGKSDQEKKKSVKKEAGTDALLFLQISHVTQYISDVLVDLYEYFHRKFLIGEDPKSKKLSQEQLITLIYKSKTFKEMVDNVYCASKSPSYSFVNAPYSIEQLCLMVLYGYMAEDDIDAFIEDVTLKSLEQKIDEALKINDIEYWVWQFLKKRQLLEKKLNNQR